MTPLQPSLDENLSPNYTFKYDFKPILINGTSPTSLYIVLSTIIGSSFEYINELSIYKILSLLLDLFYFIFLDTNTSPLTINTFSLIIPLSSNFV